MKSRHLIIPSVFLLFLVSGYVIAGFARHHTYEEVMKEHETRMITLSEEGIKKPMGWEDYEYVGNPDAASVIKDPVFQEEIYSWYDTHYDYVADYEVDVLFSLLAKIDDDRWSLWDAYKKHTIFVYQQETYYFASSTPSFGPSHANDWGGYLAESVASWEAHGGKREGNWMEIYKQSAEYEVWLNGVLAEIESPNRIIPSHLFTSTSKEEQYLITTRDVELSIIDNFLWSDLVETERRMTEIAYERYLTHVAEKDFVRATIDSLTVEFSGYTFYVTTSDGFILPPELRYFYTPSRGFIIDISVIFAVSIVLTFLVVKKVLPRWEPK